MPSPIFLYSEVKKMYEYEYNGAGYFYPEDVETPVKTPDSVPPYKPDPIIRP